MSHLRLGAIILGLAGLSPGLLADEDVPLRNWAPPPYWTPPAATASDRAPEGRTLSTLTKDAVEALPSAPLPFVAITPCRLIDTRSAGGSGITGEWGPPSLVAGLPTDPPSLDRVFTFTGAPHCTIPAGAQAVSAYITAINYTGNGHITAYPAGAATRPFVATLNFRTAAGIGVTGEVMPLSSSGQVSVYTIPGTDLIVDLNGYYSPQGIVNTVNGLSGDVMLAEGNDVTISKVGQTLTIASTGVSHTHWGQRWTGSGTGLTLSGGSMGVSASGTSFGVIGGSANGYGVYGDSTTGVGVRGDSNNSIGVHGGSTDYYGVLGSSTNSTGVYGTGGTNGVWGTGSTQGVYGQSTSGSGVNGSSTSGSGVIGTSTNLYGLDAYSTNNYGVRATSVHSYGVYGNGTTGVYGNATDTGVFGHGITGVSGSGTNFGVHGTSTNNYGVYGSGGTAGVLGDSTSGIGVVGTATLGDGVRGISTNGVGVYGFSQTWYSGYFDGPGYFGGLLTKAGGGFKIDHPLDPADKYLYHSFVESPDMKNVYDGVVTTDAEGRAVVALPAWFEALNRDFRYQLTVIGQFAQAIIEQEIADNRFVIRTDLSMVKVSWQVTGIRQDPWANAHRLPVEEDKPGVERGSYLHPDVYGQPEEKSVEWARQPEMMRRMKAEREKAAEPEK